MNLSAPFIQRPIMTTLVMLAILLVGIGSYFNLPVSNMPSVEYPVISISAGFPGANPETMANTVATPLEIEFLTIDGLLSATSSNTLGSTSIVLQFDLSKDINTAAQDVQAAISRALPNLPPQLPSAPTYRKVNPSLSPIIILSVTSETTPLYQLYDYANTLIGPQLSLIKGVAQVLTYGSPYAVRVQVDPNKLASTGITLPEIADALAKGNPSIATGALDGKNTSPIISVNGQLVNAKAFNSLIVNYTNNSPIRIQDLGNAVDSLKNYRSSTSYVNQLIKEPGVILAILPQPGSNVVQISGDMQKRLPSIIKTLPASVNLRIVNDKTDSIKESIVDVEFTLLIAFFLVVLIIFLYLGKPRETLIPALVLPISAIGTFAMMEMFNFSLNNLSLLAIILAIGFIIDDAIVVIENIVRYIESGESPWNAALKGSHQISFTIVSMTLSLIAVFIPLLFMKGLIGKILSEFAITLTIITLLSGFISLTLTPMLCSFLISARKKEEKANFGQRLNQKLIDYYKPGLRWIINHRKTALFALFFCIFISFGLLIKLPRDFIPNDDIGFFIIYTQSAEGTSSDRMNQLQKEVEEIVSNNPYVDQFSSMSSTQQARNGFLYVRLKPRKLRKPILEVISDLNQKTSQLIGINSYYKNIPMIDLSVGFQVKGAYQYVIKSLDSKKLLLAAADFIRKMRLIPGLQGINSDLEIASPEVSVEILRDKASSLGISADDIENAFSLAYAGGRVSRIQTAIDQYDVILELERIYQRDISTLNSIYLRSSITGNLVPLSAVCKWSEEVGPTSVNHLNRFPAVTISYNLSEGINLSDVVKQLQKIEKETLPSGVSGNFIGAAQTFQESIISAAILLIITLLVIYIVLGILYESFIHPITILTTLPPAVLGGLLVLYFFNLPLSLYSFLGIILLIGIVKKNGIMVVDFALENMRTKNESPEDSIYEACIVRFRPIMMTTLTSIVGAIPIACGWGAGADARRPLGLVIIGGLLVSQLITLFITPVIYLYMEKVNIFFTISLAKKNKTINKKEVK